MKNYMAGLQDLRGNTYLNPSWPAEVRPVNIVDRVAVHHDAMARPHSYDSVARYISEAAEHYKRLGPGLQYHFKIDNVGTIFWIRGFNQTLYAVGDYGYNRRCINICLDGYLHPNVNEQPTREQCEALEQLLTWLDSPDSNSAYGAFPYTRAGTFSHRNFSSTACCGNNMAWRVDHYRDNGVVPLNDTVYDWPEYQPAQPPAPAPTPAPPAAAPEWEKNAENVSPVTTFYAQKDGVPLVNLTNGQTERTYGVNTSFAIARRTKVGNQAYLITQYSASKNIWKGLPLDQLNTAQVPPSQADPTPLPTEPPVENPQAPVDVQQNEKLQDHDARLSALEKIVKAIQDFLSNLFKGFGGDK